MSAFLWRIASLSLFACLCGTQLCSADGPMRYVYNAPESELDQRYVYHWEILRTALEKTFDSHGAYELLPSERMSERRQAFELETASGKISVMYLSTVPRFEERLIPIRIPVDRNLSGYFVLLVRQEDKSRFAAIRTLEDLRKLRFGLGLGWIDVGILRFNGFEVVTGSNYDGLFEMLIHKRFDVFPRSAVEVLDEYAQRKESLPELLIEEEILLVYPLPMYFWFSRTEEGRRLAERAENGMRKMIADGTYDRIFDQYQGRKIRELDLRGRKRFEMENPNLSPQTPLEESGLWLDIDSYR